MPFYLLLPRYAGRGAKVPRFARSVDGGGHFCGRAAGPASDPFGDPSVRPGRDVTISASGPFGRPWAESRSARPARHRCPPLGPGGAPTRLEQNLRATRAQPLLRAVLVQGRLR